MKFALGTRSGPALDNCFWIVVGHVLTGRASAKTNGPLRARSFGGRGVCQAPREQSSCGVTANSIRQPIHLIRYEM